MSQPLLDTEPLEPFTHTDLPSSLFIGGSFIWQNLLSDVFNALAFPNLRVVMLYGVELPLSHEKLKVFLARLERIMCGDVKIADEQQAEYITLIPSLESVPSGTLITISRQMDLRALGDIANTSCRAKAREQINELKSGIRSKALQCQWDTDKQISATVEAHICVRANETNICLEGLLCSIFGVPSACFTYSEPFSCYSSYIEPFWHSMISVIPVLINLSRFRDGVMVFWDLYSTTKAILHVSCHYMMGGNDARMTNNEYTAWYEGTWMFISCCQNLEKVFKRHLLDNVLEGKYWDYQQKTREISLTVFDTIWANSSKLSLPSRSWSPSMIVLSTICWSCWSCSTNDVIIRCSKHTWMNACRPWDYSPPSFSARETALHWKWNHLDPHHKPWMRLHHDVRSYWWIKNRDVHRSFSSRPPRLLNALNHPRILGSPQYLLH